ncbi:DUF7370 family protein [Aquabacterium sp. OR-4]|uniref:DUF7370 family protein n=1 Tax=Aquabacterium sp. OR-4 TaxID=2978127 RepID=UPI0021B48CCA|nr:hypothetical protein [Aquabacterium sp. OR-4]MDT7834967.1 hypothetical protein [Aquabacterium sp. OR-4]
MITAEQAAEYLDASLGVTLPSFIVQAAVEEVAPLEVAMVAAGYSATRCTLVQSMAVAILAAAGDPKRLQSQGAPSGASRSFKHSDKALSALRRSLAAQDTAGITTALIGPDPAAGTLLMVV